MSGCSTSANLNIWMFVCIHIECTCLAHRTVQALCPSDHDCDSVSQVLCLLRMGLSVQELRTLRQVLLETWNVLWYTEHHSASCCCHRPCRYGEFFKKLYQSFLPNRYLRGGYLLVSIAKMRLCKHDIMLQPSSLIPCHCCSAGKILARHHYDPLIWPQSLLGACKKCR